MGKKEEGFHVEWNLLPFKFSADLWLAQESLQPYPFGPLTFLISTLQVECHSHFFRPTLLEVFPLTRKRLHLLQLIRRKTQRGILKSVNKKNTIKTITLFLPVSCFSFCNGWAFTWYLLYHNICHYFLLLKSSEVHCQNILSKRGK